MTPYDKRLEMQDGVFVRIINRLILEDYENEFLAFRDGE